ncbi:serine/threonine-protein phosphatase 4 regulatory subunit 4-like isoform X2 [Oscarella lobularis]|uniref:serine/threonine-protein phosphatase 4 regulatory subunit 4-like isoform X2 n=1 Tax=Oscarella lobularis TaxID=121494 RepID=UPI00331404B8
MKCFFATLCLGVSKKWLRTLLVAIGYFPKDILKREMLGLALTKGQLSQSVSSRLASCEILGKMSTKFDSFWIKKEIFGLATSLCQDVDYDVRSCMCRQLKSIAHGLGRELTASLVFPEIIELMKDEECSVRISSIETLAEILDLLDENIMTSKVIPLVHQFISSSMATKDQALPVVCQLYGKFCHVTKKLMSDEQKDSFIDIYRKLCGWHGSSATGGPPKVTSKSSGQPTSGSSIDVNAECRRRCAYNFPAMLLFVESQNFVKELSASFHSLCTDKHAQIRRTIALGFHEVAKALGHSLVISVKRELILLMKDPSLEVLQGLVPHLGDSLKLFAQHLGLNKTQGLPDFVSPLVALDATAMKFPAWRLHEAVLKQFSCLPDCLTSDQIYFKFIPRLFKIISTRFVLPVKLAACKTLCVIIRHNRKLEQRQEMCHRLVEELGASKSYRNRLLFIDLCIILMEVFSKHFFKEVFFEYILVLAKDPVANVRLKLCHVLPKLKRLLKLPTDRLLLQQLETVIRHLLASEKDKDVAMGIREAIVELDGIEIPMETINRKSFFEEDVIDTKKEEEERLLIIKEEEENAREAAEAMKSGKQEIPKKRKSGKSVKDSPRSGSQSSTGGTSKKSSTSKTPPVAHKTSVGVTKAKMAAAGASTGKRSPSGGLNSKATSPSIPSHLKIGGATRPSSSSPRLPNIKSVDASSSRKTTIKHNS